MDEFRNALELVSGYLDSEGIEYVIVGGVAVMFHGVPRTTVDIDIILDIGEDEIKPFVEFLTSHGFVASVEDMEAALREGSLCTVFFKDSLLRLDIQGVNTEFDKLTLERAIRVDLFGSNIRLGSVEDTLINKILFQGEQDLRDALGIFSRKTGQLDLEYIDSTCRMLDILQDWKRFSTDAIAKIDAMDEGET